MQGLFDTVAAVYQSIDRELEVFRTGTGLAWGDHHAELFEATERSFRPGYRAHLVQEWIPALDGVHEKLAAGGRVADVGCGHGASTVLLAEAYPNATVVGYDYHAPSIEAARKAAAHAGVADRVRFEVADATAITGPYDLIAFFAAWHDTADPVGVARAARRALADGGAVLLVEPFAARPARGQPHPPGPARLRLLRADLRPRLDQRGRTGPRRPGRGVPHPATVHRSRVRHLPARRRDPAEPRLRGPRLTTGRQPACRPHQRCRGALDGARARLSAQHWSAMARMGTACRIEKAAAVALVRVGQSSSRVRK